MLTIDVPGLMMIFAVAIIAYLIICFFIGAVSWIYIYFRFLFFPDSIEPYLRIIALHEPDKYQSYIEYFGLAKTTGNYSVNRISDSVSVNSNYLGED